MDIVFFGFGNPDNRGCEALLRTTTQLTKEQFPEANCVVLSNDFGLREMPKLSSVSRYEKSFYPRESSLTFLLYYGMYRLFSRADILCNIMHDLVDMYRKLVENETQVRTRLHGMMPMYIAEARKAIDFISQIILGTEALV